MGLNVFTLFVGSGLGSLAFQILLSSSLSTALVAFGAPGMVAAAGAVPVFRTETPARP